MLPLSELWREAVCAGVIHKVEWSVAKFADHFLFLF